MATQGPRFPGTSTSVANAPTSENSDPWVNPGNIAADDGSEAQITAATFDTPDISQRLTATNFTFTIPTTARIDGITVEVDRRSIILNSGKDFRVQLLDAAGALVGDNKAVPATIWPTTSTIATYGGAADTWTASPTPAMVNNANFGVVLSCQANIANADVGVDFIRITITYTDAVVNTPRFRARPGDTVSLNSSTFSLASTVDFSQNVNETFRIRWSIQEIAGVNYTLDGQLECRLNAGAYQDVTTTSTVAKAVASAQFNDGDATTDVLPNDAETTFVAGSGSETGNTADVTLNHSHTELEYALQLVGADVVNGDVIDFRVKPTTPAAAALASVTAVEATQTPLGGILNTDTVYQGAGLGQTVNTTTYGATTLGAQESSANSYPP